MRALVGKLLGPAFETVVGRLDPTIDIEDHLEFARQSVARWPTVDGVLRGARSLIDTMTTAFATPAERMPLSTGGGIEEITSSWHALDGAFDENEQVVSTFAEATRTIGRSEIWTEDPNLARTALARLQFELDIEDHSLEPAHDAATEALLGLPPRKWFVFKRGTFMGSARLLAFLIRVCASSPEKARDHRIRENGDAVQRGTVDVLDRLIKHVEVRRANALGFANGPRVSGDDEATERLRFGIALVEASRIFGDLRYLNTAMKIVDMALPPLRKQQLNAKDPIDARRHLAYLVALAAQEVRLREVFTT